MVQAASRLTELNSMRAGGPAAQASLPDLSLLETHGYMVFALARIKVLNTDPQARNPDEPWHRLALGGKEAWHGVLNGTFTYDLPQRYHMNPVGSVMRDGELDTLGLDRSEARGGVAVLDDGTIVVGRSAGNSEPEIQAAYGDVDRTVRDFMGGGALLVEYGQPVSSHDLREVQAFTSGTGGIEATQLQKSDHAVIGIRNGQAFAFMARNRSGREIRSDLLNLGFSAVVKLAGGSAAFYRDRLGTHVQGANSVGFGLRIRRH